MVEAAASRASMSVCDWINEVILEAVEQEGVKLAPYVLQEPKSAARKVRLYCSCLVRETDCNRLENIPDARFEF